jgi:hypothetical protein
MIGSIQLLEHSPLGLVVPRRRKSWNSDGEGIPRLLAGTVGLHHSPQWPYWLYEGFSWALQAGTLGSIQVIEGGRKAGMTRRINVQMQEKP